MIAVLYAVIARRASLKLPVLALGASFSIPVAVYSVNR